MQRILQRLAYRRKPKISDAQLVAQACGLALKQVAFNVPGSVYQLQFRINGKVWALTGAGKSEAGRAATSMRREDDLARDSVAFIRQGKMLLGRYDPGALNQTLLDSHHALHPLAAVVCCLSEEETAEFYGGHALGLVDIDAETVGYPLVLRPYPAPLAQHFFDKSALAYLYDHSRRLRQWHKITAGVTGTRWLLAPWMPTADGKGALYSSLTI